MGLALGRVDLLKYSSDVAPSFVLSIPKREVKVTTHETKLSP